MSHRLIQSLRLIIDQCNPITIKQVTGTTKSIGRAQVKLTIGKESYKCIIHIVKDFIQPLLIGLDIGKIFDLQVDIKTGRIYKRQPCTRKVFNCTYLCENENVTLSQMLTENQSVFSQNETDIGRISIAKHKIVTTEHPPIQLRPFRLPQTHYDEIHRQVKELLVKKSTSPWAFPVSLVDKKDGDKRMVIDFRKLNQITIDDKCHYL